MSYLTGSVQRSVVTLASADVVALKTVPFAITPAPPSGFMIHIIKVILNYKAGTRPFGLNTTGGGSPHLRLKVAGTNLATGDDGVYSSADVVEFPGDQWSEMPGMFFDEAGLGGAPTQPVGSIGATKAVTLTLTQVQSNGATATYFGTITNGNTVDGILNGYTFTVTGFTNGANNGTFVADNNTNSTATTIELVNPAAVNETHAASAVSINKTDGNPIQLVSLIGLNAGGITAVTVPDGGTGYAPGDTGTVDNDGSGAIYTVLTAPGGVVATVSFLQAGNGYSAGFTGATTTVLTGGGDGTLLFNISTVQTGNGSLQVSTYYEVIPLP